MMVCGSPPSQSQAGSMVVSSTPPPGSEPDPELHTFREALAICGKYLNIYSTCKVRNCAFLEMQRNFCAKSEMLDCTVKNCIFR